MFVCAKGKFRKYFFLALRKIFTHEENFRHKTNQLKAHHYLGGPELIRVHHAEQHLLHGAHAQILPVKLRGHTAPYLDIIQSERFTPFSPKISVFFMKF